MGSRRGDSENFKNFIFLLLFLVLVKQSASTYQWTCSPYDSDNDRYYLPYFGETSEIFDLMWQDSTVGATYVYPINSNELNCSGLVTALEFCYTTLDFFDRNFFNFQILSRDLNNVFNVMKSILIRANPSTSTCNTFTRRCCEIMEFDIQDQFNITSPDLAIAFGPRQHITKNHEGLVASLYPMYTDFFHIADVSLDIGSSADLNAPVLVSLRLAWLHITPFPSRSTPPPSRATTELPTLPISEVSTVPEPSPNNSESVPTTNNFQTSTFPNNPDPPVTSPEKDGSTTTLPSSTTLPNNPDAFTSPEKDRSTTTLPSSTTLPSNTDAFTSPEKDGSTTTLPSSTTLPNNPDLVTSPEKDRSTTLSGNDSSDMGGIIGGVVSALAIIFIVSTAIGVVVIAYVCRRRKTHLKLHNLNEEEEIVYAVYNPVYEGSAFKLKKNQSVSNPGYDTNTVPTPKSIYTPQEYEDVYVEPARDVGGLHAQLERMAADTINRDNIRLGDRLGSGQFAVVFRGEWECSKKNVEVAVKTLKEGSSDEDRIKFLQEAAIMYQFRHLNVVTMYGVVTDGEPIFLVLEILKKGDLRNYLLSMKLDNGRLSPEISGSVLLSYCRQVALGMLYLSNKSFIHRDLAARNILVSDDGVCKIADFGMSHDLADENYYVSHGGRIPVKWTAPEALCYKKYSTYSDVWSYGALMFEIWSVGQRPFAAQKNVEVITLLNSGYRLPPPPGCPRAIYSIMMSCWHPDPNACPSFSDLSSELSGSECKLLHWSEEDKSEVPSASELGADLSISKALYRDLQVKFLNTSL